MQKSAPVLDAPPLPSRPFNGAGKALAEAAPASLFTGWYAELVRLIPKKTRKAVRKTIKKAVRKHGPEIATAIVTGVVTSLLNATTDKKKKKKKKKH